MTAAKEWIGTARSGATERRPLAGLLRRWLPLTTSLGRATAGLSRTEFGAPLSFRPLYGRGHRSAMSSTIRAQVDFVPDDAQIRLMSSRRSSLYAVLVLCVSASTVSWSADEAGRRSVQQQLDELRAGQERLFKEVEEIKRLLVERGLVTNSPIKAAVPEVTSANVHGEPFRGTNTARIAIIEYSDFDCSFCGKYARNTFPHIDETYIKSGKVRYFFRDLPEPNETNSWLKARGARCAGDQGQFWEMHDLLFSAQSAKGEEVIALAQTLGLDAGTFNACLSQEKYLVNIQRSVAGAKRMGLYGTPAFLIGALSDDGDFVRVKKVLVGAESFESISSVLEELLAATPQH
jgi:protein-disulfide isomerase